MLLGDFNARTSKLEDSVSKEGNTFTNDISETSFEPKTRESFDNYVNKHGKNLIEICKNCDLRILNGRTLGDSFGKPTFYNKNGSSVVDYIICDQELTQTIENFIVKPPTYLSDHSQLVTWIKKATSHVPFSKTTHTQSKTQKLPLQFIWDNNSMIKFTETLKSAQTQQNLQYLINSEPSSSKEGVNIFASKVEDLILHAAKKSLKIKKKKTRNTVSNVCNKKWFDKECRLQRHSVRKLANQKHRDPLNTEIRDKYHVTLKIYKNTLKHKKEIFHEKKLKELERVSEDDPNSFWKVLKNMSDDFEDPSMSKPDVSADGWLTHFQSLHAKHTLGTEQINILRKLRKLEEEIPNNFLDEPISEEEIISAAKKLKNNKSAYSDRIKNEMLKCSVKILLKLHQKLFNLILETGHFPDQWCEGLITPIFKSGDKTDPNNYRGICVTSCLSKFLCIILNQRLSKFSTDRNIIHPSQIGFQSGHRTADHIFSLKTIIDKHINQNKNDKIYACFVDFKKAFDSVWHEGLFLKLLENKIDGNFYNLVKSLYSNSKCAVKESKTSRTEFFPYYKGVRQGCILSPLLFNIYINELATLFDNTDADSFILPNGTKLTCLLYADDLILLSRSKFGLQKSLDELHGWSKNWLMEINLKKTQIMIIEKRKTRKASPIFNLGNRNIAIVQEYCYLGVKLNHNGNFTLALKQLSEKALHALYGIRRQLNFSQLNPKYAIKIFDSIISPILLYNSEVWGIYVKNDFNNWDKLPIEKVHLKFCKIYLAVSRKASNIASRAELGKFPLIINVFKRVFRYITHLNLLPETTIAKQAFLISKDLYSKQKTSFYGNAVDFIKNLNLNEEVPNLEAVTSEHIKTITKTLEEKYLTFWKHKLENSSKLTFYSTFKTDHNLEKYLVDIKDPYKRKCLSRFRVSNHNLQIEIGRYQNIPREERLCQVCNSGEVESETHVLLSCKAYEHSRQSFRSSLLNAPPNEINLNCQTLSADIMKSTDSEIINKLSKFVYSCFEQRLKYLETRSADQ